LRGFPKRQMTDRVGAASVPAVDVAVSAADIDLMWQNVETVTVNYISMDVELLFSHDDRGAVIREAAPGPAVTCGRAGLGDASTPPVTTGRPVPDSLRSSPVLSRR